MSAPGERVEAAAAIPCLDENAVALYLAADTSDEERDAVRVHLDTCDNCRELVAGLVRTLVSAEPDEAAARPLPRGTNLARYVVLDPIGSGGMGVVYSAYDPELDRKVALKLLRSDVVGPEGRLGRSNLLSEAQAMARLSHPNIITVFDVGTWQDEVFFAMEFVRGQTLRSAQAAPGLRPRRVLELYLAAGTGLAAAHHADIIHRDFKPENVLVGDDGRVRVTDFGLARAAHDVDTRLAGTPAYMAPEQWRGAPSDARTDQYSFCVALYEALYGSRPVRRSASSAPTVPPAARASARVPAGVGRVLARGLEPDPAARWPSMDGLVAALREARRPFRTRTLLAVAALVLLTAGLWARHALYVLRVEHELTAAAQRLPDLLRAQHDLIDLQASIGLRAEGVLEAFGQASNMDAALGLAEKASKEEQFAEAHEVMRSADLPGLKERDVLLLVNAWGRVILNLADVESYGVAAPALPLLVGTMDEVSGDELWSAATLDPLGIPLTKPVRRDDLLLVSARPVIRGASVVGAMLTGSWLGRELLDELGRTAGAGISLRAPDGGWAGQQWTSSPPLGRFSRLRSNGRDFIVFGVRLGESGSHTPLGEGFVYRELAPETGLSSAWLRWGLVVLSLAALSWLAWLWFRYE
ncbi:MAG: protein kinase domain-containing protein [Myxococcaceae bacterium]